MYSLGGELFKSPQKKYKEVIFFVHFYEGNKRALRRHIEFVNELGFDAFAFNLKGGRYRWRDIKRNPQVDFPLSKKNAFGIKHVYADQIEMMLNQVAGDKIIFAFSNPSASAIEAMARRNCSDVKALICDSGPSAKFIQSAYNLYTHDWKLKPLPLRVALTPFLSFGWSLHLHRDIHLDLSRFPQNFPILSIRGWKDPLIPPDHIDRVFEPHSNIQWQKLSLPEAGHLNGLKDFADEYQPGVQRFLSEVATRVD